MIVNQPPLCHNDRGEKLQANQLDHHHLVSIVEGVMEIARAAGFLGSPGTLDGDGGEEFGLVAWLSQQLAAPADDGRKGGPNFDPAGFVSEWANVLPMVSTVRGDGNV